MEGGGGGGPNKIARLGSGGWGGRERVLASGGGGRVTRASNGGRLKECTAEPGAAAASGLYPAAHRSQHQQASSSVKPGGLWDCADSVLARGQKREPSPPGAQLCICTLMCVSERHTPPCLPLGVKISERYRGRGFFKD